MSKALETSAHGFLQERTQSPGKRRSPGQRGGGPRDSSNKDHHSLSACDVLRAFPIASLFNPCETRKDIRSFTFLFILCLLSTFQEALSFALKISKDGKMWSLPWQSSRQPVGEMSTGSWQCRSSREKRFLTLQSLTVFLKRRDSSLGQAPELAGMGESGEREQARLKGSM